MNALFPIAHKITSGRLGNRLVKIRKLPFNISLITFMNNVYIKNINHVTASNIIRQSKYRFKNGSLLHFFLTKI
jgi:hypothetical protein